MKQIIAILLLTLLIVSCDSEREKYITQTENQYEKIDGEEQIVSQIIKTLRTVDSLPIAMLTKVSNYNNDSRLNYLTGLAKEDGIQDYLLDSIYYDNFGNDTLKKSFVNLDNKWQPIQTFHKKFREDKQVNYFMTERPFKKGYYFRKEVFYSYNSSGSIFTETEFECQQRNVCDSIFKKEYIYSSANKLDSTVLYSWKNNEWIRLKRKTAGNTVYSK